MIRRTLTTGVAVVVLIVAGAPAEGQAPYPPAANFLTVSDTTLVPGQTFTITSGTYLSGTDVTFTFLSQPVGLGSAAVDADGVATLTATVPQASVGTHTVTANGTGADGEPLSVSTNVTVVATDDGTAAAGTGTSDLPRTGGEPVPVARIGAALLAVGAGLVFLTRRRRRAATT